MPGAQATGPPGGLVATMDSGEAKTPAHQIKIVIMGDGSAGKTSIINQYCQDAFQKQYNQTIGIDWYSKQLELPGAVHVVVQIWDIGGQSLTGKMIPLHLANAQGVMLVYDVTNQASFDDLEDWLELVRKHCDSNPATKPHIALVANKLDLAHLRVVRIEAHSGFAKDNGMSSHFVCAKNGDQINVAFRRVVGVITGIEMTKSELQRDAKVMKAEIVQYGGQRSPVPGEEDTGAKKQPKKKDGAKKSSMCSVQ